MFRLLAIGVAVALLSASLRASAEPSPNAPSSEAARARSGAGASGVAAAKENYEAGVKAYQNGRHEDAIRFFTEADRLAPSAPLSFNIARVYERIRNGSQALRYYRDYLRRAPGAANAAEVRELVKKYEAELASQGRQQLSVLSTPSGATAIVNGKTVGTTPWTGDLEPGAYHVELTAPGYAPAVRDITLSREHAEDAIVTLEASAAPTAAPGAETATAPTQETRAVPAAPTDREPAGATDFSPWQWVALGAGGAALGGALAFELLRDASEDDARRETRQIQFSEKLDQMESRKTTARVLLGAGGALLLTGGVLVLLDEFQGESGDNVGVSVAVEPRGAAASLSGAF